MSVEYIVFRYVLAVPYAEREVAKGVGARWDPSGAALVGARHPRPAQRRRLVATRSAHRSVARRRAEPRLRADRPPGEDLPLSRKRDPEQLRGWSDWPPPVDQGADGALRAWEAFGEADRVILALELAMGRTLEVSLTGMVAQRLGRSLIVAGELAERHATPRARRH